MRQADGVTRPKFADNLPCGRRSQVALHYPRLRLFYLRKMPQYVGSSVQVQRDGECNVAVLLISIFNEFVSMVKNSPVSNLRDLAIGIFDFFQGRQGGYSIWMRASSGLTVSPFCTFMAITLPEMGA